MNSPLNDRWTTCARAARSAPSAPVPPMPYGFATRVLRSLAPAATERLELWTLFARRALACATFLTLAAAAVVWWEYPALAIEAPAVADEAIEQALWQP